MNFQVKESKLIALTPEADKLMKCPTERVESAYNEIRLGIVPYDADLKAYDLSDYGLTDLEEEFLFFLRRF